MIKFIQYIKKSLPLAYELYLLKLSLNKQPQFHPYSLFRSIDYAIKGFIDYKDIQEYFEFDNNTYAHMVIKIIDASKNKTINYRDFFNFFKVNLQDKVAAPEPQLRPVITLKIKSLVNKILLKEIEYIYATAQLKSRFEYYTFDQIYELFLKLDTRRLQMLNADNFIDMLKQNNQGIESQIINVILRKQFNSQIITFHQFYQFFQKSKKSKKFCYFIKKLGEKKFETIPLEHTPQKQKNQTLEYDLESTKKKHKSKYVQLKTSVSKKLHKKSIPKIHKSKYLSYFKVGVKDEIIREIERSCHRYLRLATAHHR